MNASNLYKLFLLFSIFFLAGCGYETPIVTKLSTQSYLYQANHDPDNTVSMYKIDSTTGLLTSLSPASIACGMQGVTIKMFL